MPMHSRSNNWASKLVIVLQFTAWISVGIVLLQKGVTSLRSQSAIEARGTVQAMNDDAMIGYLNEKTKRTVKQEDSTNDSTRYEEKNHLTERSGLRVTEDNLSTRHWNRRSSTNEESEEEINTLLRESDNEISSRLSKESDEEKRTRAKETDKFDSSETNRSRDVNDSLFSSNETQEVERKHVKESSTLTGWNDEKKLRTRLNTGGAAAAIAMVAVGAAMLVVGPIVIVLRAIDKRRQERRYLKSTTWDDQPPTYEQATLMNEAPRYSTLNLNAVHTSRASSLPSTRTPAPSRERSPPG